MFDKQVIESLPKHEKELVEAALASLARTQIFDRQQQVFLARLAAGAPNASDDDVLTQIREYRINASKLLGLKSLGDEYRNGSER